MDKKTFGKRLMLWTAVVVAVVILVIGLCFGKVVEANLGEEIGKWIVAGLFVVGIFEFFAYILAPFIWHCIYDKNGIDGGSSD